MGDFYDKPSKEYWERWHKKAYELDAEKKRTGKVPGKGNIIKAGTYEYEGQEQEGAKESEYEKKVNEALELENDDFDKAMEEAARWLEGQTMQDKADKSTKQDSDKEKELEEANRIAAQLLADQTKQARIDRIKEDSEKGDER